MADAQPESVKNRKLSLKKMEALVREMQDSETGVPLRRHKLLLTAVPDAMAGYDMIEWLMEHYNLDDSSEAISLALQLCLHCFIYPVTESRDICVKDDSSIYKFHPESAWPSRGHEPDSRSYAVYLVKKQMRKDKPRLHAIDEWESEEHARLKMNLSAHWTGISAMAEEQLKLEKNRKKTEKLIAESQERAYWMVYRPPPGAPNRLEVPPYVQLRQPDRITVKKCESELEFLKNHVARSRTKVSMAAQSLISHTMTYAEFDPFITPPIPSNPWITDDLTFWTLNADFVDLPTERRVKRWAISSSDVLKDPTGRREFEKYLQTEYSHENIRFWMACNRLKNFTPTSLIGARAKEIFDEFLARGAPCEVNIDSKTLDWTVSMLNTQPIPRIIFTRAQVHVFHLLTKDCYPRFVRSEYYKNLLAAAQQAGQRRRMFGFGPSSKKKASGVDGGGTGGGGGIGGGGTSSSSSNLQQQGGPSAGSGSGGGGGGGGAGGAGGGGGGSAGSGSTAAASSASASAGGGGGLSRNASDKMLKQGGAGAAATAVAAAAGVGGIGGCIASIMEQDRRLSHSHSTSDLRKIDASASLGGDDVCPWEEAPMPGPERYGSSSPMRPPSVHRAQSTAAAEGGGARTRTPPINRAFLSADVCPWDDGAASGTAPETDVCPWDAHEPPAAAATATAVPKVPAGGADGGPQQQVGSASCVDMQQLCGGGQQQSPHRQLSRTVTPAKGLPAAGAAAVQQQQQQQSSTSTGAGYCDVCPWDTAGEDVPKPPEVVPSTGKSSDDKRREFVSQSRQIKSCDVGSRLAPPAPRKPQRNSVAAIETHLSAAAAGLVAAVGVAGGRSASGDDQQQQQQQPGSTRTPSLEETDESAGHVGRHSSGNRSLKESSIPESLAEIDEEGRLADDQAAAADGQATSCLRPRPDHPADGASVTDGSVRFRLESDTSESVTPTSAMEKLSAAQTSADAPGDGDWRPSSASADGVGVGVGGGAAEDVLWRAEMDRRIDAIFDEADVDTQYLCHIESGTVHAQSGYSGQPDPGTAAAVGGVVAVLRTEYAHFQSQELWDAETVPDEFVLEPGTGGGFVPFTAPMLDRIPEETGSETSSITTDAVREAIRPGPDTYYAVRQLRAPQPNPPPGVAPAKSLPAAAVADPTFHSGIACGRPLAPLRPGERFLDLDPEPTHIMPIDPLPNVPLPHRSGFLGTYAAPMPQPDNTLMVLRKAKEALEKKILEEAQRQEQLRLQGQQQQQQLEAAEAQQLDPLNSRHASSTAAANKPSSQHQPSANAASTADELQAGFESSSAASSRTATSWGTGGTSGDVEQSTTATSNTTNNSDTDTGRCPLLPLLPRPRHQQQHGQHQAAASTSSHQLHQLNQTQQHHRLAESSTTSSSEEKLLVSAIVHSTSSNASNNTNLSNSSAVMATTTNGGNTSADDEGGAGTGVVEDRPLLPTGFSNGGDDDDDDENDEDGYGGRRLDLPASGPGFDMDDPTSISSLLHGHHPRGEFDFYSQALAHATPPPPPQNYLTARGLHDLRKCGSFAPCPSKDELDKLESSADNSNDLVTAVEASPADPSPSAVSSSESGPSLAAAQQQQQQLRHEPAAAAAVVVVKKQLRFEVDAVVPSTSGDADAATSAGSVRSDKLRNDGPGPALLPLQLKVAPVVLTAAGIEDIKFIDESSSEEVGTPVASSAAEKFEEIKAELMRRAADPNVRRVLPTDPCLRHIAETLLPTHLRRVTIVESVTPSVPEKVVSDIVTAGTFTSAVDQQSSDEHGHQMMIRRVLEASPSPSSTSTRSPSVGGGNGGDAGGGMASGADSASQETLVGHEGIVGLFGYSDPHNARQAAAAGGGGSTLLDPLDVTVDTIKPMEAADYLLSSLWSTGEDMFVGVPPLPDELYEPDLLVSDIVSVPPPPPRYSESDLELNKTLSKYGGLPSYPLPVADTPTGDRRASGTSIRSGELPPIPAVEEEPPASKSSDSGGGGDEDDDAVGEDPQKTPTNERLEMTAASTSVFSRDVAGPGGRRLLSPGTSGTAVTGECGNRTVLGSLPVFGSPLNVGSISSVAATHDGGRSRDTFGSIDAISEPFQSSSDVASKSGGLVVGTSSSSSRKKGGRSSSQKDRDRHRSSSRRKRESCRTETANTPVKPADICPWENEELCRLESSTFVKTYATFGYL